MLDYLGDRTNAPITGLITIGFIVCMEVVEVTEDQGYKIVTALGSVPFLFCKIVLKQRSIGWYAIRMLASKPTVSKPFCQ